MSTDDKVIGLSNKIYDFIMDSKVDSYEAFGALEIVKSYLHVKLAEKAQEPAVLVVKRLQ